MEKIKEIRANLHNELNDFVKVSQRISAEIHVRPLNPAPVRSIGQKHNYFQKPHPYANLGKDETTADADEFDPIVRISTHHDKKTKLKQPDLNLAEYYYESMNEQGKYFVRKINNLKNYLLFNQDILILS